MGKREGHKRSLKSLQLQSFQNDCSSWYPHTPTQFRSTVKKMVRQAVSRTLQNHLTALCTKKKKNLLQSAYPEAPKLTKYLVNSCIRGICTENVFAVNNLIRTQPQSERFLILLLNNSSAHSHANK